MASFRIETYELPAHWASYFTMPIPAAWTTATSPPPMAGGRPPLRSSAFPAATLQTTPASANSTMPSAGVWPVRRRRSAS